MLPVVGIEGKVVGEPQLKFTDSGKALVRFRVKAADRRRDDSGAWVDGDVLWVTATAFGKVAENAAESLIDGDQVVMIGKWSTSEWTDDQGNKRSAPRFLASAVGAGLAWVPRKHSEKTMAAHQGAQQQRQPPGQQAQQPATTWGSGAFSDAAVAREQPATTTATSSGAGDDPWG